MENYQNVVIVAAKNHDGFFGALGLVKALDLAMDRTEFIWTPACRLNQVEVADAENSVLMVVGLGQNNCPSKFLIDFCGNYQGRIVIWVDSYSEKYSLTELTDKNGDKIALDGLEYWGEQSRKFLSCLAIIKQRYPEIDPEWLAAVNHLEATKHPPKNESLIHGLLPVMYQEAMTAARLYEKQYQANYTDDVFRAFLQYLLRGRTDFQAFMTKLNEGALGRTFLT